MFYTLVQREELGILIVLILVCLWFTVTTKSFATIYNAALVIRQFSIIGIMAVGMFFIVSAGGIDLSIGAILAVSATTVARSMAIFSASSRVAPLVRAKAAPGETLSAVQWNTSPMR